jgi:hypothetical protein
MADTITGSGYRSDSGDKVGSIGKRTINLLPRNPMDKVTIVSIYPREIVDVKPTLFPARFVIPAAKDNDFSLLIIEGASYFIPSPVEKQPPTEVQVNAMALAESILYDSIPSMNLVSATHRPGVFAIPGEFNKTNILKYVHADGRSFQQLLNAAREWQMSYWTDIMNEADYFWSASNGNPKAIPADAKLAAKILGIEKTKPWMSNVVASELVNCKACGEMINPAFPVCKHCHHIIDEKRAKELGIKFASE